MARAVRTAPSILSADFARLSESPRCVEAGADALVAGNAAFKSGPGAYAADIVLRGA